MCVCAYGTDEFPAFFTRRSGCQAPVRADDPETAARMVSAALQLDLGSGIVIGGALTVLERCSDVLEHTHATGRSALE